MFCSDVFPKGVDTPQFGFPRHRNAKPCIFQIGIKIQQIGALGKEQELMLWIFTDLCKYLVSIIGDENMIQEMPEEFNKVLEMQKSWQK